MKKLKNNKGFTMVEMLIVLLIVSVLSVIIVPNVIKTKQSVEEDGKAALTQVIETQADLYEFEKGEKPSLGDLLKDNYINQSQFEQIDKWGIGIE